MAWPTDRTESLNDVATNTYRRIIPSMNNLITEGDLEILRIADARGAIEAYTGGDEWKTTAIISGGAATQGYDPSDENPSQSVTTVAEQTTAPIVWKAFAGTQNANWAQGLTPENAGPLKVADVLQAKFMAKAMKMLDDAFGNSTTATLSGFWSATTRTAGEGVMTAYTMFADKTVDLGLVDVSTYTFWKPQIVTASNTSGTNFLKKDMQSLINACRRGVEGGITDLITTQTAHEKYTELMIAQGTVTDRPTTVDFGADVSIPFGDAELSWTRYLSASTFWDVTSTTAVATHPVFGIDFRSAALKIKRSSAMSMGTRDFGLFHKVGNPYLQETALRWSQRFELIGNWYFRGARRTSGYLSGLSNL